MLALIRVLCRLGGCGFLAAALVVAVVDGSKMIAQSSLTFTSFGDFWATIAGESLTLTASAGALPVSAAFTSSSLELLAYLPVFMVFALAGLLLMWIGWSRQTRSLSYV